MLLMACVPPLRTAGQQYHLPLQIEFAQRVQLVACARADSNDRIGQDKEYGQKSCQNCLGHFLIPRFVPGGDVWFEMPGTNWNSDSLR